MYTIKRAAELTGISLSTLRAWERRYGVVAPARSDGRYRLYTDGDLRALSIMAALVQSGWTASEAAAETRARVAGVPGSGDGAPGPPVPTDGLARLDDLLDAAGRLDVAGVGALLDEGLAAPGFEQALQSWLLPMLHGVGDAWADGRLSVAGEHLVSHAVQRRLAAHYDALPHAGRASADHGHAPGSAPVLLGLPPGARHELGILAFAVLARSASLSTVYLGADLPTDDWVAATVSRGAGAVVVAVPQTADIVPAQQVVDALGALSSPPVVCLGGAHQAHVTGGVRLGHDLGRGVQLLRRQLPGAPPR